MRGGEAKPFRILSLDGGGIRGAFIAGYLAEVERLIAHPIGEYFDLVAGTSTGGIIAAGLAFRVQAARIVQFYRDRGPQIFRRWWRAPSRLNRGFAWLVPPLRGLARLPDMSINAAFMRWVGLDIEWMFRTKYGSDELIKALDEVFGDAPLEMSKNRLVIPSVNVKTGQTKVFKTGHLPGLYRDREYRVSDIVRSTAAAPTYFPHAVIAPGSAYVDGGLWANNPVVVAIVESMAIAEAMNQSGDGDIFNLGSTYALSIGTGCSRFFADPPAAKAGIIWWNPAKLLNVISLSQSQGAQFQASYLLRERLKRVEFKLPGGDWSLDNVAFINEMIHMGDEAAGKDIAELRSQFFTTPAPPFVPYASIAKPQSG